MIDDLVRRIEATGPGKRVRLATIRRGMKDPPRELFDPELFSRAVTDEPALRTLLYRDRHGAWWRRRFLGEERRRAVLDLSNLFWTIGGTEAEALAPLLEYLGDLGIVRTIGVADANLPYSVRNFDGLRHVLDELVPVSGGEPADPTILDRAERERALIISNDRFRDWKKSSRWRRRNIERLRCPLTYRAENCGPARFDLGRAADELRFDRDPAGRYDTT